MAGRPSSYKPEFAEQATKLCLLGATDEDLADFFKVSIRTIANWKTDREEFLQALKAGKDQADDRVERSLYQRAVGYTFDAVHFSSFRGKVTATEFRQHVAPDVVAQIFWLKNRRPDAWRDKQIQEVTGANGAPLVPVINLSGRPEPSSAS
jgi:hypothetical protein